MKTILLGSTARTWVIALCLFSGISFGETVSTDEHSAVLNDAIAALDEGDRRNWAFTETSFDSDGEFVGRFDPRLPAGEGWTLLSIDGRAPSDAERMDYTSDKGYDGSSDDDDSNDANDIIEPGSLTLLEETEEFWLFSFVPIEDEDDEGFFEHVDATVKIIKDGPYLAYIDMHSPKPFKLQFGVKINNFVTRLQFGPVANGGPIGPQSVDIDINVRAFLIKTVNESIKIRYSDYEYVGS